MDSSTYVRVEFPVGRAVVVLDLEPDNILAPGSVPLHVRELDVGRATILERQVIPSRLSVLAIDDMTEQMHIPLTVGYLFVWNYSGKVQLPLVRNVFIHAFDVLYSPINRDHYIHLSHSVFDLNACHDDDYVIVGRERIVKVFGRELRVLKRALKVQTQPTVATPIDPTPVTAPNYAQLIESQQQLVAKLQSWISNQAQTYNEMAAYLAQHSKTLESQLNAHNSS